MDNKTVLTPIDVAKELGIGRPLVYRMLEAGVLKGVRAGDKWLISRLNFDRFINGESQGVKPC